MTGHVVPPPPVQTTVPSGSDTVDPGNQVPALALVLLWSAWEPHRVGEVAFLPVFETRIFGRGDDDVGQLALFAKQRPGEPYAPSPPEGLLAGDGISRRQLVLRPSAVAVDMEVVGRCVTLVNGDETTRATLKHGDTIMLRKQVLLGCVRRPKVLAGPRAQRVFGGPDANGNVGESPAMWALREELARAAAGHEHVLLQGESGTGKEQAAGAIHRASERAKHPFVRHNSANCTLSLLESELFGNLVNYPSHGMPARPGLFGAAHLGSLLLDEIGELPLEAQAQLLRALDSGEYHHVGDAIMRHADVRAIGATNRDDSYLRPDLRARFGRTVRLPPLRERREDIPLLIRHWLRRRGQQDPDIARRFLRVGAAGAMEPRISGRLVDYLVRHPLPANVRELEALLLTALEASVEDEVKLPASMPGWNTTTTPPPENGESGSEEVPARTWTDIGKEELEEALAAADGNGAAAAKTLGVHRNDVYKAMRKYGIKKKKGDGEE